MIDYHLLDFIDPKDYHWRSLAFISDFCDPTPDTFPGETEVYGSGTLQWSGRSPGGSGTCLPGAAKSFIWTSRYISVVTT